MHCTRSKHEACACKNCKIQPPVLRLLKVLPGSTHLCKLIRDALTALVVQTLERSRGHAMCSRMQILHVGLPLPIAFSAAFLRTGYYNE